MLKLLSPPATTLVAGLENSMVGTPFDTHFSTSLYTYFSYGLLWPYPNLNVNLSPGIIIFGGVVGPQKTLNYKNKHKSYDVM